MVFLTSRVYFRVAFLWGLSPWRTINKEVENIINEKGATSGGTVSLTLAFGSREQGIYTPSWGRSVESLLAPVTVQCVVPPHCNKREHNFDNFWGKCPTTTPLVTATEYRSTALQGSLSHTKTSPTAWLHMFLYIWWPRIHNSLCSSSKASATC